MNTTAYFGIVAFQAEVLTHTQMHVRRRGPSLLGPSLVAPPLACRLKA